MNRSITWNQLRSNGHQSAKRVPLTTRYKLKQVGMMVITSQPVLIVIASLLLLIGLTNPEPFIK